MEKPLGISKKGCLNEIADRNENGTGPHLLFTRKLPPCLAANILDIFFSRIMRPGFLTHLHSLTGYNEPEILLKQNLSSV